MAGPVTGAPLPGAGRHSVGAKSPLTGGFGEAEAGGFWGAELKHAGYDGIVVQGKAEKPVYLWIDETTVEIRDAAHLWGKRTGDVEDAIRAEHGDRLIRIAQTGVAGENLVRYAMIVNDLNEIAGRTGHGRRDGLEEPEGDRRARQEAGPDGGPEGRSATSRCGSRDTMDENHYNFHHYGTGAAMVGKHLEGHLIVRNWQDGTMDTVELIDAKTLKAEFGEKMDGCYACSVRCKKRVRVDATMAGVEVEPKYGGAEYETLGAIGTNLGIDDLVAAVQGEPGAELVGARQRLDRRDDRPGRWSATSAASSPKRTPAAWRSTGATARS